MRAGRRRSRLLLALLLLGGLLLALEVVARVADVVDLSAGIATPHQGRFNAADLFIAADDEALSYSNRPLASATIDGIEYRHDEHGWRVMPAAAGSEDGNGATAGGASGLTAPDGPTRGAAPPAVAFLGDSTTYGLSLPARDSLPALVASALGGTIRSLNLGVCGFGTNQEAALYVSQRAALSDVQLVVLVFFPNDFARGAFLWDSGLHLMYVDPLPLPFALKGWLWRSELYRAAASKRTANIAGRGDLDAGNPANQALACAAVEHLAALVRADGKQLLVAHLPAMERLDPYLFEEPVAQLAQTCARIGVSFVDLLPAFLAERDRQIGAHAARGGAPLSDELRRGFLSQFWIDDPRDHHLDAAANRIAAAALAPAVRALLAPP